MLLRRRHKIFFYPLVLIGIFLHAGSLYSQNILYAELDTVFDTNIQKNIKKEKDFTYSIKNNLLYKTDNDSVWSYQNRPLGPLHKVSFFSKLKLLLFYKNTNQIILLDQRMSELEQINFNNSSANIEALDVAPGFDNSVWIFNAINSSLQRYDYHKNTIQSTSLPIDESVLQLESNYNFCYVLTQNYIREYNYLGNLNKKWKNNGFSQIQFYKDTAFLLKGHEIFLLDKNLEEYKLLVSMKEKIDHFLLSFDSLYIYSEKHEWKYNLLLKNTNHTK